MTPVVATLAKCINDKDERVHWRRGILEEQCVLDRGLVSGLGHLEDSLQPCFEWGEAYAGFVDESGKDICRACPLQPLVASIDTSTCPRSMVYCAERRLYGPVGRLESRDPAASAKIDPEILPCGQPNRPLPPLPAGVEL